MCFHYLEKCFIYFCKQKHCLLRLWLNDIFLGYSDPDNMLSQYYAKYAPVVINEVSAETQDQVQIVPLFFGAQSSQRHGHKVSSQYSISGPGSFQKTVLAYPNWVRCFDRDHSINTVPTYPSWIRSLDCNHSEEKVLRTRFSHGCYLGFSVISIKFVCSQETHSHHHYSIYMKLSYPKYQLGHSKKYLICQFIIKDATPSWS